MTDCSSAVSKATKKTRFKVVHWDGVIVDTADLTNGFYAHTCIVRCFYQLLWSDKHSMSSLFRSSHIHGSCLRHKIIPGSIRHLSKPRF